MDSINELWNEVCKILSAKLTPTAMKTWFSDCKPIELTDTMLILQVKDNLAKNIISSRFSSVLKEALYDLFSCEMDVLPLTLEEVTDWRETQPTDNGSLPTEMAAYTFDRFIVGNSNRYAFAAANAVAQHPGDSARNPLFIYGNSGLGKTHLLSAIGQYIHENNPEKKILYIKGDDFTNRMIKALQDRKMEDFRNAFRNVDLLLVDDIQFIAGKQQTQEEFFNTFNSIYESGHQIVITSDRPPKEMATLEDRLVSRFEGGIMADVQPPDFETRMVITRKKAAQLGLILSDEAIEYISNNITANIRQIEGVIKSLSAYKEIINGMITLDYVKRAIENVVKTGVYIPSPDRIIKETSRYYNLKEEDLKGQNRSKNTAEARQVAMYLMRSLTNLSLKDIGEQFGGRNHATVLSSIRKIEEMLQTDSDMTSKIRDISSNINTV